MADDVVAELDAELALIEQLPYRVPLHHLAQRARDEIVALREKASRLERGLLDEWGTKLIAIARAEALEKAAKRALDLDEPIVAAAIRALKKQ